MSSESDASFADGGSLALFCATVLFHRRYILYRERRHQASTTNDGNGEGRHNSIKGTGSFDATDGYYDRRSIGRRRRISFDGHASFAATDTTTSTNASSSIRRTSSGEGDDTTSRSPFPIFGGDEMDDDEVNGDEVDDDDDGA